MVGRGKQTAVPAWMKDGNVPGVVSLSESRSEVKSSTSDSRYRPNSRSPDRRRSPERSYRRSRSRSRERDYHRYSSSRDYDNRSRYRHRDSRSKSPRRHSRSRSPGPRISVGDAIRAQMNSASTVASLPSSFADTSANALQTKPYRRIYVGNLPVCSEAELGRFFNDLICRSYAPGEYVVSTYIQHEKKYGFIELRTIEMAEACLSLDGVKFQNNIIRIKRPSNALESSIPKHLMGPPITLRIHDVGLLAQTVADSPNKLFVSGLPITADTDAIRALLETFGTLKALQIVRDAVGVSKGYAFFEYRDELVTALALEQLNGLPMGDDKFLVVKRASDTSSTALANSVHTDITSSAPLTGHTVSGSSPTSLPSSNSRILSLSNLATEDDFKSDDSYVEFCEDVKGELSKYGSIVNFVVPKKPINSKYLVFIEYSSRSECEKAVSALQGRTFASRVVQTEYVSSIPS